MALYMAAILKKQDGRHFEINLVCIVVFIIPINPGLDTKIMSLYVITPIINGF